MQCPIYQEIVFLYIHQIGNKHEKEKIAGKKEDPRRVEPEHRQPVKLSGG
jgi:hypothetical protein